MTVRQSISAAPADNVVAPRPTMHDVAEAAGVSVKTVSRLVNGEPGVGQATARRVEEAIAVLGYRRNELARSLRQGRSTATVGLVIGDVSNPFYSVIARAAEEVARERGYLLVTGSSDEDPARERELVSVLARRRVDGLLLVPAGDQSDLASELHVSTPVVFLDRPPRSLRADAIVIDNAGGARAAVNHLLAHGHRRIGVVGDAPSVYTAAERVAGYRAALAAAGVPVDEALVRLGPHDVAQAEAATRELLTRPDPPTALFTTNNRMSVGVLRALRDSSRPVALVGFDDFELAELLPLPVTVVRDDPAEMGRRGAQLLFDRLAGDGGPPRTIVLPTELVPRGSGEVAP